uniref:Trafficking protein particle complex subunit 13 n=1 Tax=Plectus sambesii TaxID=2011161 RepID=A0A914UZB3_9BILA
MADSSRDQLLTLKVMRLTRPAFAHNLTVPIDPADAFGAELQAAMASATGQTSAGDPLGSYVVLPQSFENIYLGETFTFYMCVHNDSNQIATEVAIKADLQTSSQRVALPCKMQEPVAELSPDQALGEVISHEIKEIGQHILVCAVTYNTAAGEKMYFRKFFKFPVAKPLDVRTKFYNAENDDVYLEAQIQNTSAIPMVLERISLEPSELYDCNELNPPRAPFSETPIEGPSYLSPQDTRQFLYCLSPKKEYTLKSYRGVTSIGKLDMIWRTSMGERGRLQTSQLQRMAPGYGDLRLTVEEVPATVRMHEMFKIVCRLHNCCDRALDLQIVLDGSLQPGLIWSSTSGRHLGQVPPNGDFDVTLNLVPVAFGLQVISGIRLTDTFLKRTYEHDEVAQVFVS